MGKTELKRRLTTADTIFLLGLRSTRPIPHPYPLEQLTIPKSQPHRRLMVVPLEWIYVHPRYGWCLTSDTAPLVAQKASDAESVVYVLRSSWDEFERRQKAH